MTEQHLDLDGLADLLAAGGPEQDAHLTSCAPCRNQLAALRAALEPVAASLAAMPLPEAPADLDARLTLALERLRARPSATRVTPRAPRPAPRRLAWLPLAGGLAAAAALVLAVVLTNGGDKPSSGSGAAPALTTRTSSTGLSYGKDGALLTRELPALLHGTATGLPTKAPVAGGGLSRDQSEKSAVPAPVTAPQAVAPADPLSRLRTTAGLASCITSLTEGSDVTLPLALDYARFDNKPALVVVLPSPKKQKVDVFVVGARCAQSDADLLYFARLPAPS